MSKLLIILGSGKYESIRRAKKAAEFLLKNQDYKVICSGSYPHRLPFEKMHQTEAEYAADELKKYGIPAIIDRKARNTWENLLNAKQNSNNESEICLVTNRPQSARAIKYAEKIFPNNNISILIPAPKNFKDLLFDLSYLLLGGL